MNKIKAVFFDIDGTLLDFDKALRLVATFACKIYFGDSSEGI